METACVGAAPSRLPRFRKGIRVKLVREFVTGSKHIYPIDQEGEVQGKNNGLVPVIMDRDKGEKNPPVLQIPRYMLAEA